MGTRGAIRITIDSASLSRALDRYLIDSADDPDVVANARTHAALPIWKDFGGVLYITAAGDVLSSGWDSPRTVEPVANIRHHRNLLHAARAHAAKQFPEIAGLLPERGPAAVTCVGCDGHGHLQGISIRHPNVVCACGGLGWLPEPPEPHVGAIR